MTTEWNNLHCRPRRSGPCGYTYLGLLFLVAMIGFGLTATCAVWVTAQQREKEDELLHLGGAMRRALAQYRSDGPGYPRRLEDLLKDPRLPGVRRYLRVIPRDPVTGRAEWGLVRGPGDSIIGIHSLSVARPIKQAGFARADRSFEGKQRYADWVFGVNEAAGAAPAPGSAAPGTPLAHDTGLRSGAVQKKK